MSLLGDVVSLPQRLLAPVGRIQLTQRTERRDLALALAVSATGGLPTTGGAPGVCRLGVRGKLRELNLALALTRRGGRAPSWRGSD